MKKSTYKILSILHAWQLPLKERLTRLLVPTHQKNGEAFFEGIAWAMNGCLIQVDTRNYIEYKVFAEGGYEVYLSTLIKHYLKPNTTFLDIGANIGIHSLSAASVSTSQVISFEPIDFIREKLKKNILLNRISNITVVPLALSDENKKIRTNYSANSSNQGTFSIQNEGDGVLEIECIKGDDYVAKHQISTISVIKIDVEGFEYAVLKGLQKTISKQKPVIFFEFDTNYIARNNSSALDFDNFFHSIGYVLYAIEKSTLTPIHSLNSIKGMKEICANPIN